MDVMQLRRGLMMGMANGTAVIKGSFTTTQAGTYTISIGKTLSKYMYLIEMTDSSKGTLLEQDVNLARTYAIYGIYPQPSIGNNSPVSNYMCTRVNPSTAEYSVAGTSGMAGIDGSSITLNVGNLSNAGVTYLLNGYTYNYTIIPFD